MFHRKTYFCGIIMNIVLQIGSLCVNIGKLKNERNRNPYSRKPF